MNRLPERKKPGDPVLASDWNTLLDAISARTPRPGAGLELIASSGGFAYSQPDSALVPRQPLPPFSVIGIEKEAGKYKVIIKEGWVIERKPRSGDLPTVKFHMPEYGGNPLNAIPRPKIEMNIGDTLWCKYQTDIMGEISEEPEVIVASDDQDGAHYQPEDPEESGVDGEYYVNPTSASRAMRGCFSTTTAWQQPSSSIQHGIMSLKSSSLCTMTPGCSSVRRLRITRTSCSKSG